MLVWLLKKCIGPYCLITIFFTLALVTTFKTLIRDLSVRDYYY